MADVPSSIPTGITFYNFFASPTYAFNVNIANFV